MTTQLIGRQLFDMMGTANPGPAKSTAQGGKSFGDLMGGALSKLSSPVKADGKDSKGPETAEAGRPEGGLDIGAVTDGKQPEEDLDAGKVSGESGPEKTKDAPDTGSADGAKAEEAEEKLAGLVKDVLDLSQEELEKLMASLGFTMMDLADMDKLKMLVVKANGGEQLFDLLTDEKMGGQVKELMQGLNQLKLDDGTNLSKEELTALLKTAGEQTEAAAEDNPVKPVLHQEKEPVKQPDGKEAAAAVQENTVQVTVEKETGREKGTQSQTGPESRHKPVAKDSKTVTAPVEAFIQKLSDVRMNGQPIGRMEPVQVMREIVNQVAEQIHIVMKPENTSMEMQLNPEQLGKVHVSVTENKNGQLTAAFTVQNEAAREAIEGQIQLLRDNLDKQGLKVEAVEVTVSDFGFAQSEEQRQAGGERKKSSRRLNLSELNGIGDELTGEETLAADIMRQNGNTVDFTA